MTPCDAPDESYGDEHKHQEAVRLLADDHGGEVMTSEIQQAEAEQRVRVVRRWFTEGWAGDTAMADDM
jgi:hypothetical protein